jgi:hypothetical protein
MSEWPKQIEAFLTSDREMHRTFAGAADHQRRLDGAALANKMLEDGASLGSALRAGGFIQNGTFPELDEVNKDTKLVISHWQCSDKPGYQPREIDYKGRVRCWGDAGSWSGPWGSWCEPQDIVRHAQQTKATEVRNG